MLLECINVFLAALLWYETHSSVIKAMCFKSRAAPFNMFCHHTFLFIRTNVRAEAAYADVYAYAQKQLQGSVVARWHRHLTATGSVL